MVTIVLNKYKLLNPLKISESQLEELLFNLKSEMKPLDENNVEIEINADRLDLLHSAGIIRAIKGLLDIEVGESKYKVVKTDYKLVVNDVKSRPYALGAIVYGLQNLDLQELIQFQEKLHSTIGRKRKKVAIGIHDLDKIDSKEILYKYVSLDHKFVPLNYSEEMSVKDVIVKTEQGRLYGEISILGERSPAIVQNDGQILSLPPIINSDKTKLTEKSKNLFIDVTGTSFDAVAQTLDLIVTNLAEAGGTIGLVETKIGENIISSPLLIHNLVQTSKDFINNILGFNTEVCPQILRMRMNCQDDGKTIKILTPPYRIDVKKEIDLVEDVAMGIGYNNLGIPKYSAMSYGEYDQLSLLERKIRDLSIGANFTEVFNFVLIKDSKLLENDYVKIVNPISVEYNAVRNSLLPVLLDFLSKNQHARFPVRVFEVGDVVIRSNDTDVGYTNDKRVGYAIMDSRVSFEELQSPLHYILKTLGIEPIYEEVTNNIFMEGRVAQIKHMNKVIGILGEANPLVLNKYKIEYPVVLGEVYLKRLKY